MATHSDSKRKSMRNQIRRGTHHSPWDQRNGGVIENAHEERVRAIAARVNQVKGGQVVGIVIWDCVGCIVPIEAKTSSEEGKLSDGASNRYA